MNTYTYTAYHEIKYPHKQIKYPIYFDNKSKKIKHKIKATIHPSHHEKKWTIYIQQK